MKNKKTVYILLVAVLAIWSLIVLRFFSFRDGNDNQVVRAQIKQIEVTDNESSVEYELLLNYEDPFFTKKSKRVKNKTSQNNNQKSVNKRAKNRPDAIQQKVPIITYNGMLSNSSTGKKVGFLITGRKEYMVEAGDIINDLKIVKLWNDSVRIEWKNQMYNIKKKSE